MRLSCSKRLIIPILSLQQATFNIYFSQKFRKQYTLQQRIEKRKHYQKRFPYHVLLILEEREYKGSKDPKQFVPLKSLQKNKFIIAQDGKVTVLQELLRRKLEIGEQETLFIFINNNMISQHNTTFGEIEYMYKDQDGIKFRDEKKL